VDSLSTATAAQTIAAKKDPTAAAIASTVNASIYGLEVLQEDIENDPSNFTRFVVIQSKHAAEKSKTEKNLRPNMASFIFKTKNEPGALFNTLGIFSRHGINLTKLESRPLEGQPWTYWFYADAELKNADDDVNTYVKDLEDDLRSGVEDLRLLGIYPRDV
jgi:prephenate dehydratase